MDLQAICDLIVVIGAAYFTIIKVVNSFVKPTSKLKKKQHEKQKAELESILDEVMPKYLDEHDLKTRDRYLNDRLNYLKEIKSSVLLDIQGVLQGIESTNKQQSKQISNLDEKMEKLNNGQKDVLRQKIVAIYDKNKYNKTLSYDEKDNLEALYGDYKAIGGNSYIDKIYKRMSKWNVLDDDYVED